MTRKDFDEIFSSNINNKTQSEDSEVLEIYSHILQTENLEDYWWEYHGANHLMSMIEKFSENIFDKLRQDIPNWTGYQIELFAQTLVSSDLRDYKINERIELYLYLFEIPKFECDLYNIFYDRAYMNLELADKTLLLRLAEKLNYKSVDHLLTDV